MLAFHHLKRAEANSFSCWIFELFLTFGCRDERCLPCMHLLELRYMRFFEYNLEVELLAYLLVHLQEILTLFPMSAPLNTLSRTWEPHRPTLFSAPGVSVFKFCHIGWSVMAPTVDLTSISFITNKAGHFSYIHLPLGYSLLWMFCSRFLPIFTLGCLLLTGLEEIFIYSGYAPIVHYMCGKNLQLCGLPFYSFHDTF